MSFKHKGNQESGQHFLALDEEACVRTNNKNIKALRYELESTGQGRKNGKA